MLLSFVLHRAEPAQVVDFSRKLLLKVIDYLPFLLLAVLTLVVGLRIVRVIGKWIDRRLARRGVDPSLRPFLGSVIRALLNVAVFVSAAGIAGIETTSFVAILGAAGLAIGLALQGSLSNFAGGVMLLLLKPYKTEDYVEAGGTAGTVDQIQIFHTRLKTPDNKVVLIPNSSVVNNNITNYSAESTRRCDLNFGIAYDDDIDKARAIIKAHFDHDPRVLREPAYMIIVTSLGDSSVNISGRAWVRTDDFWYFLWDSTERIKKDFDREGITIPFPQRDVHLYSHNGASVGA
jgi:small conductance mechanosensitive channel